MHDKCQLKKDWGRKTVLKPTSTHASSLPSAPQMPEPTHSPRLPHEIKIPYSNQQAHGFTQFHPPHCLFVVLGQLFG